MPAATQHSYSFSQVVQGLLRAQGQLTFLQVGGYDGISFDPLREHILTGRLTGVIVEPVPAHFEKLQALYGGSGTIRIENCAIDRTDGERSMWQFSREALANGTLGAVFGGITSFLLPDLLEKTGTLGGLYSEANRELLLSLTEEIRVRCSSFASVIARNGLDQIDLLQIDTEGYDFELLKMFDFGRYRPSIVQYECQHLSPADKKGAEDLLISLGYMLHSNAYDTLAVRGVFLEADKPDPKPVLAVADALLADGRADQAVALYEHALALEPGNIPAQLACTRALSRAGKLPEALKRISDIVGQAAPGLDTTPYLQEILLAAINAFNEKLTAGQLAEAAPIIDGLVPLNPQKFRLTALNIARSLRNVDRMIDYATQILLQDPHAWLAHAALADVAEIRGDTDGRLRHQAMAILHRPRVPGEPDRMLSGEVYHTISEILCQPLNPGRIDLIGRMKAAVTAQPEEFAAEDQQHLDRSLRVSLDCLDMAVLDEPLADTPAERPDIAAADFRGQPINLADLPGHVVRLAPDLAFLVAADEVYLKLYGRSYLASILERCDVDSVIFVCMIGMAKNLPGVIEEIGLSDPRIIFIIDEFNPAYAVSYYTRNGCEANCARAYYQSVRFLLLGWLLETLNLPFIVSDIDLHLYGSVAGLLERHRDADLVLNRNDISIAFGSRYTANLTLIRPSPTGRQFARLLRIFLRKSLQRQDVEQFIDQTGFTLAYQYCLMHDLDRIGFFAGNEINNLMANRTDMGDDIVNFARSFVFFAYYGSQGKSAVDLMKAVTAKS